MAENLPKKRRKYDKSFKRECVAHWRNSGPKARFIPACGNAAGKGVQKDVSAEGAVYLSTLRAHVGD